MVNRALKACLDYANGEMTLKQVYHRVRGDRFAVACQSYPERDLGWMLYELNCDFYCHYGCQDEILHRQILSIAQCLQAMQTDERKH
jgi:hypothetical protein